MMKNQTIETTWEIKTYDVWGNPRDGYEVNDVYRQGEITLPTPVYRHNAGTPHEFQSAHPTLRHIKRVFGTRCRVEIDGDDRWIIVNRLRDGYPIGEMRCVSHSSLSPIRPIA